LRLIGADVCAAFGAFEIGDAGQEGSLTLC
jgi:hypothetical protein